MLTFQIFEGNPFSKTLIFISVIYLLGNSFVYSNRFQKPVPVSIAAKDHFAYEIIYNTYSLSQLPCS